MPDHDIEADLDSLLDVLRTHADGGEHPSRVASARALDVIEHYRRTAGGPAGCPECGGRGARGCGAGWHDGRPDAPSPLAEPTAQPDQREAFRAAVLYVLDGGANDPDALAWTDDIMAAADQHLLAGEGTAQPDPSGADLLALAHGHRNTGCPGCGGDVAGVGVTHLTYAYERCDCDKADYTHLTERIWHLACLTSLAPTIEAAELLDDAAHVLDRYKLGKPTAERIRAFVASRASGGGTAQPDPSGEWADNVRAETAEILTSGEVAWILSKPPSLGRLNLLAWSHEKLRRASGEGTAPQPDRGHGVRLVHGPDCDECQKVRRIVTRCPAPQVPAEALAEGVLDDAVHETDGSDAYVLLVVKVPEAEYAHHLDACVRVVAADGAPQEGDERG